MLDQRGYKFSRHYENNFDRHHNHSRKAENSKYRDNYQENGRVRPKLFLPSTVRAERGEPAFFPRGFSESRVDYDDYGGNYFRRSLEDDYYDNRRGFYEDKGWVFPRHRKERLPERREYSPRYSGGSEEYSLSRSRSRSRSCSRSRSYSQRRSASQENDNNDNNRTKENASIDAPKNDASENIKENENLIEQKPTLSKEILEVIGGRIQTEKTYAEPVEKEIAIRINEVATIGLKSEEIKKLLDNYPTPTNTRMIDLPKLNNEFKNKD